MSEELSQRSVNEIVALIAHGDWTARDCVSFFLDRLGREWAAELNAFSSTALEQAFAQAEKIDSRRSAGEALGSLAGLPIAIKDGICTTGLPTTAGSRILQDFIPPYDATVIERLKQADAIVIGKTNMDEFAMGSSTENSCYGATLNPWSAQHVAGGSSGGSAACIAAGLSPAALGSDTGGSIRQPASFCGVTGLKPTYGRVSRYGLIAYASSLDQIGPLARSAQECAAIMNVISGHDWHDSTSVHQPVENFALSLSDSIRGLRIGICRAHFEEGLDAEVRQSVESAIEQLIELGAKRVEIELPYAPYAVPAYYVIAPCEASSNLARFDGVGYTSRVDGESLEEMYSKTRGQLLGPEVQRRIMLGTYALSSGYYDAYYLQASKVRRLIKNEYDRAWEECDLLVGPTAPTPPFRLGQHAQDPLAMYLADVYTVGANLAGIPAMSLPVGFTHAGLPIGMQLQGPMFSEARLLQTAHQFQLTTNWHFRRPGQ